MTSPVAGQVPNDDFENRIELKTGKAIRSSTINCTVQPLCVDEKLTGKCVEYHNDQWFEFKPVKTGNYFLNISSQNCRDVRGVQLVVFTGQPCQPQTYKILSCTSLGSQDNVFVPIRGMESRQRYYLNVDGYRHDFCSFLLEISTEPKGLPVSPFPQIPPASSLRTVLLQWQYPDSISTDVFKIWRRRADESHSVLLKEVPVIRNAYGKIEANYQLTDSLISSGSYFYQVIAESNNMPVLIKQLVYQGQFSQYRNYVTLPLNEFPEKAKLSIIASDPISGKVFRRLEFIKQKNQPQQAYLMIPDPETETGKKIRVYIQVHKRGTATTHSFLLPLEATL